MALERSHRDGEEVASAMIGLRMRRFGYDICRWIVWSVIWLFTGWRVEGGKNVPRYGPLLVVSNHLHNADPVLVCVVVPRPVALMAKIELFRNPVLAFAIRLFGAFPVDRGAADRQAIRTALARLAAGNAVGMFPEGTRSRTASMARGLLGVGLLAARSGAPVLPVAITGSEHLGRLWPRPVITVRIGRPITISKPASGRVDHQAIVDEMMTAVAALLPPAYRGYYGDARAAVPADSTAARSG
jgi:1-acyl-sn-glycerol-3-phosphate acyltransferase